MPPTKTKTQIPTNPPDPEPETSAVLHVEEDSPSTTEQPAVLRVEEDNSWEPPVIDRAALAASEQRTRDQLELDDDEEADPEIPSLVRDGFSPSGIEAMLDLQGDWTNRLIGRTPDQWRWTEEEKRIVAEATSRISARSKMLRRAAQAEDAVVLVGAIGSYVVRNMMTAATANRIAAETIGGVDAHVQAHGDVSAGAGDGAGAAEDDPFTAV